MVGIVDADGYPIEPGWGHRHTHQWERGKRIGAVTYYQCECGQRRPVIEPPPKDGES